MQVERDDLDRLAQAHVVGQAAAESRRAHARQPGDATPLVGAQRRGEAGNRIEHFGFGGQRGDPIGQFGQRAPGRDLDPLAVDLGGTGQDRAECLDRGHAPPRGTAKPRQQQRIQRHPAITDPHQRPLCLRQLRDLGFVELLAAKREPPPEAQQRLKVQAGVRHLTGRLHRNGRRLEVIIEQGARPQHLDAGPGEFLRGRAEQVRDRVIIDLESGRPRLAKCHPERRPQRRAPAEREQQVGLRAHPEPRQHALRLIPECRGVDNQARVRIAAQLQHDAEAGLGALRFLGVPAVIGFRWPVPGLDPESKPCASRHPVRAVRQPAGQVADVDRPGRAERW